MANWESEIFAAEEREKQLRRGLEKPFGMSLLTITPESEIGRFRYFGSNDRVVPISHPFISKGAWIRAMPEAGATYVGTFRSDEPMPQPLGTYQRQTGERVYSYNSGEGVYRPLIPGEIEVSSLGIGQTFYSRRPRVESRGGIVSRIADQDALTSSDRAPTHIKKLLQNSFSKIHDEYRLGVVSRPKEKTTNLGAPNGKSTWEIFYPKVRDNFAQEEYLHLLNPSNENPSSLYLRQHGHVLDENGNIIFQQKTQLPLRSREIFYTNDNSSTLREIDENGNTYFSTATAATGGFEMDIPTGSYIKNVGVDDIVTITGNKEHGIGKDYNCVVGDNLQFRINKNVTIASERGGSTIFFESTKDAEKVVISSKSSHLITLDDTPGKEAIYIIHSTGAQAVIDETGSIKIVSKASGNGSNVIYMDSSNDAIVATSKSGAYMTIKDEITMVDKSGGQVITMDGNNRVQITASSDVILSAKKVTVAGGAVDIGDNAVFSAVLGEPLAAMFDAHIHSGVLGPTSPPLPPNTAAIINSNPATAFLHTYVKLKGNI